MPPQTRWAYCQDTGSRFVGLPLTKTETIWHLMLSTVISYKPLKKTTTRNPCAHTDGEGESERGRDKREERETDGRREKEGLLLTGKCQMLKSTQGGRAAVRKSSFCNHHDEDWIRQGSSGDGELDICMVLSISPQSVD